MLRVSSEIEGEAVDLKGVVEGNRVETGVPAGAELLRFAETALGDDAEAIRAAREAVAGKLGEAAMVDSAGIIANFQRMVRIADGTGIPLDTPVAVLTDGIRNDLGINAYGSAENTAKLKFYQKLLGRILQPIMPFVIDLVTRSRREVG